jgi:hypothetical protein
MIPLPIMGDAQKVHAKCAERGNLFGKVPAEREWLSVFDPGVEHINHVAGLAKRQRQSAVRRANPAIEVRPGEFTSDNADPASREAVRTGFDGSRVCWSRESIRHRLPLVALSVPPVTEIAAGISKLRGRAARRRGGFI